MLTKVTMSSYQLCPRNRQSRGFLSVVGIATFVVVVSLSTCVAGFYVPPSSLKTKQSTTRIEAKPQRLPENVEGALYVNSKCINCAACSMFAPTVFSRRDPRDGAHIVHHQPESEEEIDQARAALAACPVAAIRVETNADRHHRGLDPPSPEAQALAPKLALNPKFNGLELPFPRPIVYKSSSTGNDQDEDIVYHVGHHNENSFGGCPYLFSITSNGSNDDDKIWIMVDTPRYSKSAVQTIESLTGEGRGPDYLFLTHVDDTADHGKWREHYPNLKRIFHSGDLGRHNWLGDSTLNDVEILLEGKSEDDPSVPLQLFTLDGRPVASTDDVPHEKVLIVHTPGHSPGSISLWKRPTLSESQTYSQGVLFTGDTYSFTTRGGGRMTGFPRYGNNRSQQARVLPRLLDLEWQIVAPGHGHVRDYTTNNAVSREEEMQPALHELETYSY